MPDSTCANWPIMLDEVGDLIEASDESNATWRYAYTHHLITRYTDRTDAG